MPICKLVTKDLSTCRRENKYFTYMG